MILQGDVREQLATLGDESVQCVITSPAYWGLRDYGLPPQVWDDPDGCEHEWEPSVAPGGQGSGESFRRDRKAGRKRGGNQPGFCSKCNAWRGSLGLEPTPELYLQHMVQIFREIRRVLRKDGTLWLNMGDSYAGGGRGGNPDDSSFRKQATNVGSLINPMPIPSGLKSKDLCGIPWRLALALQADGWWLRCDIIWAKPNPMPESVSDRPTSSHEYVFLLARAARYFYDADAVREKVTGNAHARGTGINPKATAGSWPNAWQDGPGSHDKIPHGRYRSKQNESFSGAVNEIVSSRNMRSVWTIPTQPYPGAHFATFPEALVKRCIMAGTSEKGACPECGAPWVRVVEKSPAPHDISYENTKYDTKGAAGRLALFRQSMRARGADHDNYIAPPKTLGWQPTCKCGREDVVPCVVLDPFGGSGTVGKVAQDFGRDWIIIELNPDYCEMARKRTMHRQELLDLTTPAPIG